MKTTREVLAWLLIAAPYVYLAAIWQELPHTVPIHFNSQGPDDWAGKNALFLVPCVMPLGIYLLLTLVPMIDPKGKLREMGPKLQILKLTLTFFMTVLACYILHCTHQNTFVVPQLLFVILGLFFAALGNYFQAVRPNYFIGIRTPWTLESEAMWRATHRMGGRLWIGGGLLIVLLSFMLPGAAMARLLTWIVIPLALIPVVYSFVMYRRRQKELPENEIK